MTAPKLKLCPFCGGEAKWIDIKSGENFGGSCIYCTNCQASTNVSFQFKENLISAWNTRADLPQAAIAAAMMGAVKSLEWDGDGRRLRLDDTLQFSKSYDWDGYNLMRGEGYGVGCGYIVWPDSIGSKLWNVYGTFDGLYIQNCYGERGAKAAAQADYQTRALSIPTDAMAALEAVKAQVRIDLMKDVLTAIYGGKVKAGLVDVRYDFARGSNADQRIEDVFNMEMAILARKGGE